MGGLPGDYHKVRTDLVERLGLLYIPVDQVYYNFNFTEARKCQMVELYQKRQVPP